MHYSTMLPLLYFFVIFLATLQVSSGDFPSPSKANFKDKGDFGFGTPFTKPLTGPDYNPLPLSVPQNTVISENNPPSGSIFASVPSVTLFINKCFQAVDRMDILREALDLSQTTAKQYGDFLKQYAENVLREIGVENDNAAAIGEFVGRAIEPNFNILTLPVLERAYCNSAAHFLFVSGYLELYNAEDLALLFAQSIVDSANVTMTSDPTSKFPSLTNGYVNFFKLLGMFTKRKVQLLGYYVGNEWFVAAVNYRWL